MELTIDNYKTFFSTFNEKINAIPTKGNRTLENAIKALKDEFADKERSSDINLADNSVLKIGIVGQVKSGKSSFLNALFFDGENILPRASTPMTAGLTVLKYGDTNKFIVEYFSEKEWKLFEDKAEEYNKLIQIGKDNNKDNNPKLTDSDIEKMLGIDETMKSAKEMVSKCTRSARANIQKVPKKEEKSFGHYSELQNILEDYVGANGRLTPIVKCLTLELNDERLKDLQIVDTPGVNDPILSREKRTHQFLQECHGVFLLSNSTSFFTAPDVNFLVNRIGSQGIGTVVLIGSMLDAGLMDASGKYKDDLGNAIEYVKNSLKKQYERNIQNSDFNGDDPILDFNSSIGYSIAKKGRSRWDSMEAHVVDRMRELYPSYFDTDDDIKEMFSVLANIDGEDGIREKYIEGLFKTNMEKIIHQKMESFFFNTSSKLSKYFDNQLKVIKNQLNALYECENPAERRQAMLKLVENIKKDLITIVSRVDNRADKAVKEVLNSYSLDWDGRIPTTSSSITCTRKSSLLKRNKFFTENIETIDANALVINLSKLVGNCLKKTVSDWEEKNRDLRSFISNSINDFISEQEKQDVDNKIDGHMLNSILNETLDQISNEATLNIAVLKNRIENDIPDLLQNCDIISKDFEVIGENEARSELKERVRSKKTSVRKEIRDYLSGLYPDIASLVKDAAQKSTSCIKEKKGEFIDHISSEINKKIDELEEQIKDINNNKEILSSAIKELEGLQKSI